MTKKSKLKKKPKQAKAPSAQSETNASKSVSTISDISTKGKVSKTSDAVKVRINLSTKKCDGKTKEEATASTQKTVARKHASQTKNANSSAPKSSAGAMPSAAALAMHKKWQEAAEAVGGKSAKIVVRKPDAKKLIFETLKEAFKPMNITDLYKTLRAVVPSPVLKACLDDMAPVDSLSTTKIEDEEGEKSKGPYDSSLIIKNGRNTNTTLYFVDYSKLDNNGNGLTMDDRNKLMADLEQATSEELKLKDTLNHIVCESATLSSEPTNNDADAMLASAEEEMTVLNNRLEHYRKLIVNASRRNKLQKNVESVALHWRKRKRKCMDFLIMMEDCTEGTISVKKCVGGSGQIEIESDESVIKFALEMAKNNHNSSWARKKAKPSDDDIALPTKSFVAVKLDGRGAVCRVNVET